MRGLHANRQKIVGMFGDSATLLSSDKGQGAHTMLEDCSAQHVREIGADVKAWVKRRPAYHPIELWARRRAAWRRAGYALYAAAVVAAAWMGGVGI